MNDICNGARRRKLRVEMYEENAGAGKLCNLLHGFLAAASGRDNDGRIIDMAIDDGAINTDVMKDGSGNVDKQNNHVRFCLMRNGE